MVIVRVSDFGFEVPEGDRALTIQVCGFGIRSTAPGTYPHVMAFPLHLSLMTDRAFPFSVLGLVHIANRIEVAQPMSAAEPFDVRVWAADLDEHERGTQFQIHAEAMVSGEIAWRSVLGDLRELVGLSAATVPASPGSPNLGGPAIAAGGVLFIGATIDPYLRAFATADGRELWKARLPTSASDASSDTLVDK